MDKTTIVSLVIVVGVVGIALYLATRESTAPAALGAGGGGGGFGDNEAAGIISASGQAVGSVLGGIGSLIGGLYGQAETGQGKQ